MGTFSLWPDVSSWNAGNDRFLSSLSFSSISLFLTLIMQPSWFTATLNNALQTDDLQSVTLQHTLKKSDKHTMCLTTLVWIIGPVIITQVNVLIIYLFRPHVSWCFYLQENTVRNLVCDTVCSYVCDIGKKTEFRLLYLITSLLL